LGNSSNVMRAPFGVKGGKDVTFRHNTVVGDLPSMAFVMRLNAEGSNPPNENIQFFNNIWSDPTGTMGAENPSRPTDFSDTPPDDTLSFTLSHNLYWNGPEPIPSDSSELVNYNDDAHGIAADPLLRDIADLTIPRWDQNTDKFADGSISIRQAFEKLVLFFGKIKPRSPALKAADPDNASGADILGNTRPAGFTPDIGCYEYRSSFNLPGLLLLLDAE